MRNTDTDTEYGAAPKIRNTDLEYGYGIRSSSQNTDVDTEYRYGIRSSSHNTDANQKPERPRRTPESTSELTRRVVCSRIDVRFTLLLCVMALWRYGPARFLRVMALWRYGPARPLRVMALRPEAPLADNAVGGKI